MPYWDLVAACHQPRREPRLSGATHSCATPSTSSIAHAPSSSTWTQTQTGLTSLSGRPGDTVRRTSPTCGFVQPARRMGWLAVDMVGAAGRAATFGFSG